MDKLDVARAQLGTALDLFIRDKDPVSVHTLAVAGCAVVDGLAEIAGSHRMVEHTIANRPALSAKGFYELRNQFSNAFKHVSTQAGEVRDDDGLIGDFSDINNDIVLFVGWHDYMLLTRRLPVAAQVFQIWWYALNPNRLVPGTTEVAAQFFPDLLQVTRQEQKRRLARKIEQWRNDQDILGADATEVAPLSPRVQYLSPNRDC